MAKLRTLQSALNAGELSPWLRGRPDIARHQHGLQLCRNALPLASGGATRRMGARFSAYAAGSPALLFPFKLAASGTLTGYTLAFGDQTLRFFKDGAQIEDAGSAVEVATPYTAAQIPDLHYDQFDNVLYLTHPDHPPQRLVRTSDTAWTLEDVPFTKYPYFRPAGTDAITLTPSGVSGAITLTASAALFTADHVGARFQVNGGIVKVTAYTSATQVSATVLEQIPGSGVKTKKDTTTITIDNPVTLSGGEVIKIFSEADFNADTLTTTYDLSGAGGGGYSIDTQTTEGTLTGTEADPDWKEQSWSDVRGWPQAIGFFEQRMLLGGTASQPTSKWASKTGDLLDFWTGTLDDEALALVFSAATTPLHQFAVTDQVVALTHDKEFTVRGGGDSSLTPTSFQIKERTTHGASPKVRPLKVGGETLFATPSGQKLRALRYALESDGYRAPDFGVFAAHLLEDGGGIVDMAYTREPHPAIWAVTAQGELLTFVYDRDQEVMAWARHDGDDKYLSVTVIPDSAGVDQVWLAVERTVDGQQQVCIEYLDTTLNTDSAVTGTDGVGKTDWTGLDHLEGREVDIVADGYVLARQTVNGGQVSLPFAAKAVEIGLPYKTTIKDLPPHIEGAAGAQASCNRVRVWLHESQGCTINGETIPFRSFGDNLLDQTVQPFTGWKQLNKMSGWGSDGDTMQVEIVQDQPLPLTVLAIVKEVSING